MDLRGAGALGALAVGLSVALFLARPHTAVRVVHPQSHPKPVSLGPNDPDRRVPGPKDLAAAFPAFAALSPEAQQETAIGLAAVPGPCEPCLPRLPLSRCAIDHPPGCENLPAVVARAVKLAAEGADSDAIIRACSYGDAWIPGVSAPNQTGPVPIALWIDLGSPFLADIVRDVQFTATLPDAVDLSLHILAPSDRADGMLGGAAAYAADQQGLLLPYASAVAAVHGSSRVPLTDAELVEAAGEVSALDRARWDADRASTQVGGILQKNQVQALSLGVRTAPTWFVNGYRMRGLQSQDALSVLIRREASDRQVAGGEIPWRR